MRNYILCAFFCVFSLGALVAQENPAAPVTNEVEDKNIVFPESMTERLSTLLHEWQLDLSKTEEQCKRGSNVVFHDSVYTKRLYVLPSEMELSFNQVVKTYIEMYAGKRREQVSYMLSLGDYYFPMFEEALDRYKLPLELKYLPVIESALNPIAVSRVGATGLWQFMLRTGQGYGLDVNSLVDERRDPYKATEAAVRYLRDLYLIYGDWNLVIAAYNCGPGNVNKAIARSGGKRDYWEIYYHLPRETRGYVPAFIAANYIMNHYADHNICPAQPYGTHTALDTVHVNDQIHFEQIADVLNISVSEIRRLNPQFKKDIIPGGYKEYALVLPTKNVIAFIDKKDEIVNHKALSYMTHRTNTDRFLRGTATASGGNTTNVYYRVKRGDNLSKIAQRNRVTVNQLKAWNGLKSTRLTVGKQLVVGKKTVSAPKTSQQTQLLAQANTNSSNNVSYKTENKYYKVRKGDTLGAIARKNGVSVAQLKSWNGLKNNNIGVGKSIVVKQEKVAVAPQPTEDKTEYNRSENTTSGSSNIISDYLKGQIEKAEERKQEEEAEAEPQEVAVTDEV